MHEHGLRCRLFCCFINCSGQSHKTVSINKQTNKQQQQQKQKTKKQKASNDKAGPKRYRTRVPLFLPHRASPPGQISSDTVLLLVLQGSPQVTLDLQRRSILIDRLLFHASVTHWFLRACQLSVQKIERSLLLHLTTALITAATVNSGKE